MTRQQLAKRYPWLIVVVGILLSLLAASRLCAAQLNVELLLLALFTVGVSSRITIRIPRITSDITVSDTFIFLILLLYGGEAALLVAMAEGLCLSLRTCKKTVVILFNGAEMACSICLTSWVLRSAFGPVQALSRGGDAARFVTALCVMALVHYLVNSWIVTLAQALKTGQSAWRTWVKYYFWASLTYIAGAAAAGVLAKLINLFGFYAFLASMPVIAVVYLTYLAYLKNVEASKAQAEQAERHAAALQQSEERFRGAFEHAAGMAIVAADGRWVKVNDSLCQMLGYAEQELLGATFQAVTHPDDLGATLGQIGRLLSGELTTCQMEQRYVHRQGQVMWALLSVTSVRDSQTGTLNLIFQIQDITDRKRAEAQLVHDAFHDNLTNLPNRALFLDHLKLAIARAKRRTGGLFAVLFLDLDRFKIINDSLGHLVGDQLLVRIAERLKASLRPGDTAARLGGDEFTVLLEDIHDAGEAIEVAGRLQRELSLPLVLNGHEVFTTVSIGIAPGHTDYDHPAEILRDADTAMYRAKHLGKARHEVFDKAMHARALHLLQLETDLRRAVERKEFAVHYQPIVALGTGAIRGFEALVRWRHPERGLISPQEFIPTAEELGLIIPIGQGVLTEACRQVKQWQEQFPGCALQVSVNLSSKQFTQPDLIEQITQVLQETGADPRCLKLEITESMMMENINAAIDMLHQLQTLGIELSIDDFGTGYSSLSYLHRLPLSTLKIDRSFVSRMEGEDENAEIVRTIILLARSLGMDVIAEGVETENQLALLGTLACEYGQGYLFSKPVDAEGTDRLLRERAPQAYGFVGKGCAPRQMAFAV